MSVDTTSLLLTLEEHRTSLFRFLRQRLGSAESAEDVLQSLSERLLGEPAAKPVDNPKAYVFRAAANAANSYSRKELTRAGYETAAATQTDQVDVLDPERTAISQESLAILQQALAELPLLTQRMFIAFRVNGEPQRTIARRFGVSLSTVEKRLSKASIHCYRRLKTHGLTGVEYDRRHTGKGSDTDAG